MRNLWVKLMTVFMIVSFSTTAQYKVLDLKPIQKQGLRYYYDFKKVSTPLALQIPLMALEDEQIAKNFRTFENLQLASDIVFVAPAVWILLALGGADISTESFWAVTLGAAATVLVLQIWSHNRMKLAIERYNMLLLPHPTGQLPIKNGALTLAWRL